MQEEGSIARYETPVLYTLAANGNTMQWQAFVFENTDGTASTLTQSGYEGKTLKETTRRYDCGKNGGKKNATTAYKQAVNETISRMNRQLDKGYRENRSDLAALPVRPMLAQPWVNVQDKIKDDTIYICQPKLNGVRCIVQKHGDKLSFMSRLGKSYDVLQGCAQLCKELNAVMPDGDIWDGEIYIHGLPLQDIVSAVKAVGPNTNKLQFWVYDVINTEPQFDRINKYMNILTGTNCKKVVPCPIDYVKGTLIIKDKQDDYLEQGYEGIMLRSYSAHYRQGVRSYDLIKMKNWVDTEYTITGFSNDVDNCIIFEFYNGGSTFSSVPAWSKAQRQEAYRQGCLDPHTWIGKRATVRCSDFSKNVVPIGCPVVVALRDYE